MAIFKPNTQSGDFLVEVALENVDEDS